MSMTPEKWEALQLNKTALELFLNGPAARAPGTEKNILINPPNHDTTMIATCVVCAAVASICMIGRIYFKCFVAKLIRFDDVLGLLGYGTFIVVLWGVLRTVQLNFIYVHQWNVVMRNLLDALYPLFLVRLFYALTMLFLKTAILLDWLRIFVPTGTRGWFFWITWSLIVVSTVFYTASVLFITFSCWPVAAGWKHFQMRGKCVGQDVARDYDFFSASVNLALDLLILVIPQRTIWKLNMGTKKKVLVSLVFSLGILACICAAGRVVSGRHLRRSQDSSYHAAEPLLWALAEMTCGFVIYCAPTARKAFASKIPLTGLVHSLRLWSRIRGLGSVSGNSPGSGRSRSRRSTNGESHTAVNEPGIYQRIEENSGARPTPSVNFQPREKGIPLTTLASSGDNTTQNPPLKYSPDTAPLMERA